MDFVKIKEQLKIDEGVVENAYQDSLGFWTIGVGRLIDKRKGGKLSKDEIEYLLHNDVNRKYTELVQLFPWIKGLDEARQGALLNMAFQLGVSGLANFKNSLAFIKAGDYKKASENLMLSLWAKQTPNRAKKMAKQIETGIWQ